MLLIMGHLYSSEMWYSLAPELAKHHRVILFDNRGTGRSDTTSGVTVEQMTADALAVLHAAGESRAHVYGMSMGGGIAGEFAMAYPESTLSVTLGCTLLKTERDKHGKRRPFVYYLPAWLVRWLMGRLGKPESYGSAAPVEAARRDMAMLAKDRFTMRGAREQNSAITNYITTKERARAKLTMPVLVMHGDEDTLVDVKYGRELAEILPHARLEIFPGAGHNYLVATQGEAARIYLEFIARVDAKTRAMA